MDSSASRLIRTVRFASPQRADISSTLDDLNLTDQTDETSTNGSESGTITDSGDIIYTPSQSTEGPNQRFATPNDEVDPPEGYTPVVPVCDHYDLMLDIVNPKNKDDGQSWGVSQAAMCLSSVVFKNILTGGDIPDRTVTRFVRNGVDVLRIRANDLIWDEDESLSDIVTRCILYPIHLSAERLPQTLNEHQLARVCTFAHRFQLLPALKAWLSLWTQNLTAPETLPQDLRPWLLITNLQGHEGLFMLCQIRYWWNVTRQDVKLHVDSSPDILMPFLKSMQSLIDNSIMDITERMYHIHLWLLMQNIARDIDEHQLGRFFASCSHLGSACDDARHGCFFRAMIRRLPERSAEEFKTTDLDRSLADVWAYVAEVCSESLKSSYTIHSAADPRRSYLQTALLPSTADSCISRCKAEFVSYWNQFLDKEMEESLVRLQPLVEVEFHSQHVPKWGQVEWLTLANLIPLLVSDSGKRQISIHYESVWD